MVVGFAVGIVVGGVALWLLMRTRIAAAGDVARAQATGELATVNERVRSSGERIGQLETALEEVKTRLVSAHADLRQAQDAKAAIEAEKASMATRLTSIPELQGRLDASELAISEARVRATDLVEESGRINAELQSERDKVAELRAALERETQRSGKAEGELAILSTEHADLKARLEAEEKNAAEKLTLLLNAKDELTNQFQVLANKIFEEKSQRFTDQNKENLEALLSPVKTQLTGFQTKLEAVHTESNNERIKLTAQLQHMSELNRTLHTDTKNLTDALKPIFYTFVMFREAISSNDDGLRRLL